jgi:hypothetical protein
MICGHSSVNGSVFGLAPGQGGAEREKETEGKGAGRRLVHRERKRATLCSGAVEVDSDWLTFRCMVRVCGGRAPASNRESDRGPAARYKFKAVLFSTDRSMKKKVSPNKNAIIFGMSQN